MLDEDGTDAAALGQISESPCGGEALRLKPYAVAFVRLG
jgi:hypothetical protein